MTEFIMFFQESDTFIIEQDGPHVSLLENQKEVAKIFIDATDNRLTLKKIDPTISPEGIAKLLTYLDEKFGAKQFFIVPSGLVEPFEKHGFTCNKTCNVDSNFRLRESSIENFSKIKISLEKKMDFKNRCSFYTHTDFPNISPENIEELMKDSKFLSSKIEQYKLQGYDGFKLMCQYSKPYGLYDNTNNRLVGFCRVTELDKKSNLYLSDTFVDESFFKNKEDGTAYLYNLVSLEFQRTLPGNNVSIFLIAPPNRVEEFEKSYGCIPPNTASQENSFKILSKFSSPKPGIQEVFEQEKLATEQNASLTSQFRIG